MVLLKILIPFSLLLRSRFTLKYRVLLRKTNGVNYENHLGLIKTP